MVIKASFHITGVIGQMRVVSLKNVDQPHSKVDAITPFSNRIGISRANKQNIEYYVGNFHWPLIASVFMGIVKNSNQ